MLGNFLKRIVFGKSTQEANTGETFAVKIKNKSKKIYTLFGNKFNELVEEVLLIRKKFNNLLDTNYQLGMTHLEKGNLSDAIFRFKFIKKFWPHHLDAHYQLAYCYFLKKNFQQTQIILKELVSLDPSYQKKADELLDKIKNPELNNN